VPALLFSATTAAASADAARSAAPPASAYLIAASSESVLTRWHDYALASITPQFTWAILPPAAFVPPRVRDRAGSRFESPSLFSTGPGESTRVALSVSSGLVSDTPSSLATRTSSTLGLPQPGVERTVVTPSLVQEWSDGSAAKLSAVLAYQRFASLGLGMSQWQNGIAPPTWAETGNTSYGAGARVDVGGPLNERLRWGVAYQSRVGMDAFTTYRGVYSDPGDFDVPANASVGISYALTPTFGVDVGVQRVMYSAITPFTSASLPTRFLALLGDGASPMFAWRDLTVYSLGWTVHDNDLGDLQLRYTTRQQPVPTSVLLENALAADTANDMFSVGWSRAIGSNTHMSFAASYASSPYLLLMPAYHSRDNSAASQLEFEALWSVGF
jgi:hypothetical protein